MKLSLATKQFRVCIILQNCKLLISHTIDTDGHFTPSLPRQTPRKKNKPFTENDGRAPDTLQALELTKASFRKQEFISTSTPPPPSSISKRSLQSYKWEGGNSCFFDNGLELWFRAFSHWDKETQATFFNILPVNSILASIFYSYQRRLHWITDPSSNEREGLRILGMCQSVVRYAIFDTWCLYHHGEYGCAVTWLQHAIEVRTSLTSAMCCISNCDCNCRKKPMMLPSFSSVSATPFR